VRAKGKVYTLVPRFSFANGFQGVIVVRIDADKEVKICVADGVEIMVEHSACNRVFLPKRNEDGYTLFRKGGDAKVAGGPGRSRHL